MENVGIGQGALERELDVVARFDPRGRRPVRYRDRVAAVGHAGRRSLGIGRGFFFDDDKEDQMATIYSTLRALVGLESGRSCRRCSVSIPRDDAFGLSESVCRACRYLHAPG
jgi:hypothetical protein